LADGPFPQPAVAPRFSRSATPVPSAAVRPGAQTRAILAEHGYDDAAVDDLLAAGVIAEPT
jgi:alpha-methylacyl-CoA racemase